MVVFGQGVFEKPLLQFVPKFEKETGCKVTYFSGVSSNMLARMKAEASKPTVDVVNLSASGRIEGKMLGLLDKNNKDILANLKFAHPKTLDPDDIGAPFVILAGPTIAVRQDKLKEKNLPMPQSWLDVANPAYKDKVALSDISVTQMKSFIGLVARSLGGNEVNDYVRAFDWMETKLKPNIFAVVSVPEWQKLLEEGSVWIGVGGWTRAAQAAAQGAPLTLVWPKEGVDVDINGFQAMKGAPNPICAQFWMNYALNKEVLQVITEATLFGPARADVSIPEKLKGLVLTAADMERAVALNQEAIAKNSADFVERWTRAFAK